MNMQPTPSFSLLKAVEENALNKEQCLKIANILYGAMEKRNSLESRRTNDPDSFDHYDMGQLAILNTTIGGLESATSF